MRNRIAVLLALTAGVAVQSRARDAGAQCLVGGAVNICDDLTRGVTSARRTGGSFVAGGWRVDRDGDHLTYDLGRETDTGALRLRVSQLSALNLAGDHHFLSVLSDLDGASAVSVPRRNIELFVYGGTWVPPAPDLRGRMMFEVYDTHVPIGASLRTPIAERDWLAATTYTLEFAWTPSRATVSRNGTMLGALDAVDRTTAARIPIAARYVHIPLDPLRIAGFTAAIGAVYSLVAVSGSVSTSAVDASIADAATDATPGDVVPRDALAADAPSDVIAVRDAPADRAAPTDPDARLADSRPPGGDGINAASCACRAANRGKRDGWPFGASTFGIALAALGARRSRRPARQDRNPATPRSGRPTPDFRQLCVE